MSNRQKVYLGVVLSTGVLTGIGIYVFYRYRQWSKTFTRDSTSTSLHTHDDGPYLDIHSSSEMDNDDSESLQSPSPSPSPNDIPIHVGSVPLTPDQAAILTRILYENMDNEEEQLHPVLASIVNASTFKESQINLANVGCITRLRELLLKSNNPSTKCKILLVLINLALNDFAITQFSGIVPIVIDICRNNPSNSLVRRYGLNLLINMSVLEYLHEEYMNNIYKLGLLIGSTIEQDDEALSAGKLLVNLSTNESNLENLLQITGVELKKTMNLFTSRPMLSSKSEDILSRYLTFYCNLADLLINELKQGGDSNNNNNSWLNNPAFHRQGALYFEFFDHDKQMLAKSLLRPQYTSTTINTQMKRLYQSLEKIRLCHIDFLNQKVVNQQ